MLPSSTLVRSAIALARWLPPGIFRALATVLGALGFFVAGRRRAVVQDTLRRLAPQASGAQRRRLARRLFRNLLQDASDLFRLPSLGRGKLLALIEIEGLEELRRALELGRGAIVVTAHVGPYELAAAYLAVIGLPVHAMVEDIDPETNAALRAYRSATGLQLISRNTGVRSLYRLLAQGQCVLLVADRVIGKGSGDLMVPFGNSSRAIPTGPAALALATGAPLVIGHIVRSSSPGARYHLRIDPAISPVGHSRDELTRTIGARFNTLVQAHPDQWYVFQPDWEPRDARA